MSPPHGAQTGVPAGAGPDGVIWTSPVPSSLTRWISPPPSYTSLVPSGDQEGETPQPEVSWRSDPVATSRIQTCHAAPNGRELAKAMLPPSGDHAGEASEELAEPCVTWCASLPSELITQMSIRPERSLTNAIFDASGETAGD